MNEKNNRIDLPENEEKYIKYLENLRWPKGIICPICGCSKKIHKLKRSNLIKCGKCEKTFTVRKGTIFEESRLPLSVWFLALKLISSKNKFYNSTKLANEIGVTQKTAWFMLERLRQFDSQFHK